MLTEYYQKSKEKFLRRLVKGTKIFQKTEKTKNAKMLVSDIEIFLKKKRKEASIWS